MMSKDDLEKYGVYELIDEKLVKKRYKEALTKILMHNNSISFEESYKILSELVERATPKKPTKIGVYKEDVECPHCKAGYLSLMRKCGWGNEYTMFNHCGNCGKAIDWSEK